MVRAGGVVASGYGRCAVAVVCVVRRDCLAAWAAGVLRTGATRNALCGVLYEGAERHADHGDERFCFTSAEIVVGCFVGIRIAR